MKKYLLTAFLFISQMGIAQDAREIIQKYLDVVSNGHVENWSKIKTIYYEGVSWYSQNTYEQKLFSLTQDKPSYMKTFKVLPFQIKSELYEDSSYAKLQSKFYFLEDKTVIQLANAPQIVKERSKSKGDDQSVEGLPILISKLLSRGAKTELLEMEDIPLENKRCFKIKLTVNKRNYYLYINEKTYLLDFWNGNEDQDQSFLKKLYNYKKIDGLLIPMSNSMSRNGIVFSWNQIKKLVFNQEISPEVFRYE